MANKKLILMRSKSGGGKTTLANKIKEENSKEKIYTAILSTDDFWGQGYDFNPNLLGKAHAWNQNRAKEALTAGVACVIIDNTNTTWKECKPYVLMAKEFGYKVEQAIPEPVSIEVAFQRNVHGVPLDVVRKQEARFESFESVQEKIGKIYE